MKLTPLVLITALLAAGSVQAQTQGQRISPEERERARLCETEMKHLCAGKTGQAAKECLQSNSSKLSGKCKEHISKSGS
jgi:hypothetical protein